MINKNQQIAINSNSKRILCLAGAGTGKTFTLIHRIMRLIDDGVSPSSILVLTFTEAAAFEMKSRFTDKENSPLFCTFHSFCYSMICNDRNIRNELGYNQNTPPTIISEIEYKEIVKSQKLKFNIKLSFKKFEIGNNLTQKDELERRILKNAVKNELCKKNVITFDIICNSVADLFTSNCKETQQYKDKYLYVFVDEFQDTDKNQFQFVSSFSESNLFCVGDVYQCLYTFRGACPDIIKSIADNRDWLTIKLFENYRSLSMICKYANNINKLYRNEPSNYSIELKSKQEGGTVSSLIDLNLDEVLSTFFEQKLQGSSAILARTNSEVNLIKNRLDALNISYTSKPSSTYIQDIIQSYLSNSYFVSYLASKLNQEDYGIYLKHKLVCKNIELKDFIEMFNYYSFENYLLVVDSIKSTLCTKKSNMSKLISLLNLFRIEEKDLSKFNISTEQTMLSSIIDYSNSCNYSFDLYVGTIHSVKGLEFDNVLVTGVNGKSFKLTDEDNINCFYVACTRAKTNLYVMDGDIH